MLVFIGHVKMYISSKGAKDITWEKAWNLDQRVCSIREYSVTHQQSAQLRYFFKDAESGK